MVSPDVLAASFSFVARVAAADRRFMFHRLLKSLKSLAPGGKRHQTQKHQNFVDL
jgi:hypothetical protein